MVCAPVRRTSELSQPATRASGSTNPKFASSILLCEFVFIVFLSAQAAYAWLAVRTHVQHMRLPLAGTRVLRAVHSMHLEKAMIIS